MVGDPARKQVVFFGGRSRSPASRPLKRDTWTWNGSTWRKAADWIMPGPWGAMGGFHDSARDEFVLVGPDPAAKSAPVPLQTWTLGPAGYRRHMLKVDPTSRTLYRYPLAYHAGLKKGLLYIGESYHGFYETWVWDGSRWTQDRSPGPRCNASRLCYDSGRGKVLLVGTGPADATETWEWDDKGWVKRQPKLQPRRSGALAYDARRRRAVHYGNGRWSTTKVLRNNLWEWDGNEWTERKPTTWPGTRSSASLVYVPALGGVLAFSGFDKQVNPNRTLGDSWVWNGISWRQLSVSPLPTPCPGSPVMWAGYDSGRQRVLAFFDTGLFPHPSVWEFKLETLKARQPYPRPGETLTLDVELPGQALKPFLLALALRPYPGIPLRPVPGVGVEMLPLAPDPLFWLSLQAKLFRPLDAQGKTTYRFGLPRDPALLWLEFHAAGLVLGPGQLVEAITNRVAVQIVQ